MKPRPEFPNFRVKYETWLLLLFSVFIFLIYSNTLTGPFIFDDRPNIQQNSKIRLKHLSVPDLLTAGFESPSRRRPVSNISFALNYLFHGNNVVGYHFVNILIHIFNSILFYFLAKTTLNSPGLRRRYDQFMLVWIPFFAAFIWGLHPLQTQSVSYIVQRMNSLATLFYVLSILLYAKGRLTENRVSRRWFLAGCAASGIIAFGTKENTATLPFFILLALITALGVGLWLSALNVIYRDINYIIPFLTQFWLFVTPIAYSSSLVPEQWRWLYALNPMTGVVEGFRWALLGVETAPGPMLAVSTTISILVLISGLFYFRRMERTFADMV